MIKLIKQKKGLIKLYLKIALLLAGCIAWLYLIMSLTVWFNAHSVEFRSPLRSPVVIKLKIRSNFTKPELTNKDKILSRENGLLLWNVYGLESTFGDKDNCKNSGRVNGFGFGQSSKYWRCYKNLDDVLDDVEDWFVTQIPLKGIPNSLCFYNTGYNIRNCDYYQKYLQLTKTKWD